MVNTLSDVNNTDNYGAGQIVLEGLEAVRKDRYVYWFNFRKRVAPFSMGNC